MRRVNNSNFHPHIVYDRYRALGLSNFRFRQRVSKGIQVGLLFRARPPGIPVREFPGIADPQNSRREFSEISEILAGITGNFASFVFFPIFIIDCDILVFNLTAF